MNAFASSGQFYSHQFPEHDGRSNMSYSVEEDRLYAQLCMSSYSQYDDTSKYNTVDSHYVEQEDHSHSPPLSFGYPLPRSYWPSQAPHTADYVQPQPRSYWSPQAAYHAEYVPPTPHAPPQLQIMTGPDVNAHPQADVPLYSPIPVTGSWPILTNPPPAPGPSRSEVAEQSPAAAPAQGQPGPSDNRPDLLELYANAPREVFPTPSDLLRTFDKQKQPSAAPESDKKVETQRKVRQRIVAEAIGFPPTDPDTISSHDKKRYYLECLEQYVSYLHEQLHLVGQDPVPLERVSTYRGLTSRSIRTMMVNMQGNVKKSHQETLEEERNFLELRGQVLAMDADNYQALRRHSTATCTSIPE